MRPRPRGSANEDDVQAPTADELVARICSDICSDCSDAGSSRVEQSLPAQAAQTATRHEPRPNTGARAPQGGRAAPANAAIPVASSLPGAGSQAARCAGFGPRPREQYRCKPAARASACALSGEPAPSNPPEPVSGAAAITLPNVEAGGRPPKAPPRRKKPQKRIQVNFRADPDVKDALRYIWYERGMTMSDACNEAIRTCFPEAFKNSNEAKLTQEL